MSVEIKLPEIGEGIESGDVLEVLVHEGDVIEKDQDIIELETDKATMGVPSPQAGKVTKVHVREGQTVPIGATLISLDGVGQAETPTAEAEDAERARDPDSAAAERTLEDEQEQSRAEPAAQRAEPTAPASASPPSDTTTTPEPSDPTSVHTPTTSRPTPPSGSQPGQSATVRGGGADVAAGPAIRRFAREVGVDLSRVTGTGPGGRISREDILTVVRQASHAKKADPTAQDPWGPIHVERLSKIRRTIAQKMHQSWETVPRVTNFDDADVTELEEFRQDSKADYAAKGIKLTSLPFVIKAVAMSLKTHPEINAALDLENEQVIYKNYVNIGIAVDSERGLVVPSLRNADDLSISEIAKEVAELADRVRSHEIALEDLRGSTFTISNLGAIGGAYSTPIVNTPEVAILLVGRSRKLPVVVDDQVAIRLMMPLSLSYDHRLVDGATAARFLNDVIGYLRAPSRLLLAP